MTAHTITLTLPEYVYKLLQAQAITRSLDEVATRVLLRCLPPVEEDLPPALGAELESMAALSDDLLWQIAQSSMNQDKIALYDVLLARHKAGSLTPVGREWLTQLREDSEELMLRKAHAYALLKSRGHKLPTLDELRV
ncbi:hypothetical protein PN36_21515 [Candidatus Thiomargarita nelsonii]|uniref:Uncharacterized protein n=1 Tax=Candidatus Thiomargarita nelsonii TaxID=1003181 RepID=A0A0A6P3T4_9GAMM|nr:hypothetical protein PN36_21515 [Candidatus Thiomargarita nelsonii]